MRASWPARNSGRSPTVNPDGLRAHTRKNAHGVDLNRNYPYRWRDDVPHSNGYYPGPRPASEPETRAVMAFVQRIRPDLSIWYHQPWGAVLACRGQAADRRGVREAGRHDARAAGARACTGPRSPGRCTRSRAAPPSSSRCPGRDQRRHGGSPGARGPQPSRRAAEMIRVIVALLAIAAVVGAGAGSGPGRTRRRRRVGGDQAADPQDADPLPEEAEAGDGRLLQAPLRPVQVAPRTTRR